MGLLSKIFGAGSYTPLSPAIPPPPPPPPSPPQQTFNLSGSFIGPPPRFAFQGMSGTFPPLQPITGLVATSGVFYPTGFTGLQFRNAATKPSNLDIPSTSLFDQKISQEVLSNITVGGKKTALKQSDYKAAGGEGVVYVKNGTAYKIYHDPKKMIAPGKIAELKSVCALPNVLGPQEVIYLDGNPVGFTMRAVNNTEFLCKLFSKGFRDKNGLTPKDIASLVKGMQNTLLKVHDLGILVVDYNEMNFLTDKAFKEVYHIDVDSWQTPSYPATAIMESIRDRKVKNRKFTKESDWFSFACVAFQLYIGCHPYKGRHPDYSTKEWLKMMDDGVSIFNKKCRFPPATHPLDVIPKGHLKWFEAVLEKGERSAPPEPDDVNVVIGRVAPKVVSGNATFDITTVRKYGSDIESVRFIDGVCYVLTKTGLYADGKEFSSFPQQVGFVSNHLTRDFVPVQGDYPVVVEYNSIKQNICYKDFKGNLVGETQTDGFFVANRALYTVSNGSLVENAFAFSKKTNASSQIVANIFDNHEVFDGLVVQHMLGTCRLTIPYALGKSQTIRVQELDKTRILDAKYSSRIAVIIYEKGGVYNRMVLTFDENCVNYTCRIVNDVDMEDANFIVKDNGVCVLLCDGNFEVFKDASQVKTLSAPLDGDERLLTYKNDTLAIKGDTLHKIASK